MSETSSTDWSKHNLLHPLSIYRQVFLYLAPDSYGSLSHDPDHESLLTKFETFFNRATYCKNLTFSDPSSSRSQGLNANSDKPKRQLVLLEDLPNILHPKTQTHFHDCLKAFVDSPVSEPAVPVVIIISDTGLRGEARDERMASGFGFGKDKDQVVDVRTVLSRDLLQGPCVTQVMYVSFIPSTISTRLTSRFSL